MNNPYQESEEVSVQAAAPNLIQRVIAVFASPTQLGERLRQNSPWFVTLSIVALVSVVMMLITPAELIREAAEAQMAAQGREGAPLSTALIRAFGIGGIIVVSFGGAALVAGVLYLIFNVIFGQSDTTYRQHLSAVAHVFWISLLGGLILFPLQVSKGYLEMRLGLGLLLPDEPSSLLGYFLTNVTIFGLWAAASLGAVETGLSGGRVSAGKSAGTILVLYLLFAGVMAVFPTIRGG
ncbi:MAG: hypothetical protein V3U63_09320 [Gemmatimonadota bacterium]